MSTLSFSLLFTFFFSLSILSPLSHGKPSFSLNGVNGLSYSFFHISDIHYDPLNDPVKYNASDFCRAPTDYSGEPIEHARYSYVLDVPGEFGRYGCDTPDALFMSALIAMQKLNPSPDFILFTGDSPAHQLSAENQIYVIQHVVTMILSVFPATLLIPAIGNNDVYPDYTVVCGDPRLNELYMAYIKYIPSDQSLNYLNMGSYVTSPVAGLRVISLNTIFYSTRNSPYTSHDPCGQFAWFQGQLDAARKANDKVYIIGHIIPGMDPENYDPMWYPVYITTYVTLVQQYNDIIYGSFYGHIHRDEFRILNSPSSKVQDAGQSSILAASSISPVYQNNPSFRVFEYNTSLGLVDYYDYYLDLPLANKNGVANWTLEYTFSDSYKQSSLSTNNLNAVYNQMQSDAVMFSEWYDRRVGQYQASKQTALCVLSSADAVAFEDCMSVPFVS